VIFDNGPVNLLDPDSIDQLSALIGRIESDPNLTVVVFRSDKPGYFMAHWDFLVDNARVAAMQPGPTGLHPYVDNFVRLSRLPVATISEIRGRTRGAGSEFVLATDIRFASETAVLGQFEVGVGAVPEVGLWRGLDVWLAAAARWRSCSAAMTFPRAWPLSTVT
jgi:enoyl-CoA hydratase/carnithine racemase